MNPCSFSPSRCHIDLAALRRNFARLGRAEKLMPVIKSDAYGHGLLPVARALDEAGARRFAVGTGPEGLALREAGLKQPVVVLLGALDDEQWRASAATGLSPVVGDFESLERAAAHSGGAPLRVVVKCETGMGRLGFREEDLPALTDRLRALPGLAPELVLSHLSCADAPDQTTYTAAQLHRFTQMSAALCEAFPRMRRSLCNSAGTLGLPEAHFDICRPGIALYGGNPFAGTAWETRGEAFGLEWAMSVSAPVVQVRRLVTGQSVSYGRIFTAPAPMTVAVVGIGYAAGFARALSNRASMLLHGRRVPQVGRVCMGMIMADVSCLPEVRQGDTAWLMGGPAPEGQRPVTAQELARTLGTISYEVLCLMGGMNDRVHS